MSDLKSNGIISSVGFTSSIINNFTQSRNTQGWTLGGTLNSDGVAVLTGTAPTIISNSFYVDVDDIYRVDFNINMVSPSSSGDGLHLGITSDADSIRHVYNWSTGTYTAQDNASSSWNTYFLGSFKLTQDIHVQTYVVGANVDVSSLVPKATDNAISVSVMQLKSAHSTAWRAGYNTNTTMTLYFWGPNIEKITGTTKEKVMINPNYISAGDFIEY